MPNQLNIVVDGAILSDSIIGKKEYVKLNKYQELRQDVEGEGNSGPINNSTQCSDPQAGRVAPTHPRKNIQDLCPEERSPRNSKDTAQDPQTPRPLVEDPSLKDK